jgi:hypothetical protein
VCWLSGGSSNVDGSTSRLIAIIDIESSTPESATNLFVLHCQRGALQASARAIVALLDGICMLMRVEPYVDSNRYACSTSYSMATMFCSMLHRRTKRCSILLYVNTVLHVGVSTLCQQSLARSVGSN